MLIVGIERTHPVVVGIGTGFEAGHLRRLVANEHGVARQGAAAADDDVAEGGVGRVFEGNDVAASDGLSEQSAIVEESASTGAQAVAPSVHHHVVAGHEGGLQPGTVDGVDGKGQ